MAYRYSSESTQWELSNEYQHNRVWLFFKNLCVLVHWTKVASALEGLKLFYVCVVCGFSGSGRDSGIRAKRVLSSCCSYLIRVTSYRTSQKSLSPCALDKSSLSIGRVKALLCVCSLRFLCIRTRLEDKGKAGPIFMLQLFDKGYVISNQPKPFVAGAAFFILGLSADLVQKLGPLIDG